MLNESFRDLASARLALLGESCEIANSVGLEYAVCGGWSPFIRNSSPIKHPGTKDVDLLFENGVQIAGLREVFNAFRKEDFLPSAKHEFQLLKVYSVDGTRMAFNVDLLHPTEGAVGGELFVDHVELPVVEDTNAIWKLKVSQKSIATPYSKFIFSGFIDAELIDIPHVAGGSRKVNIPLIDEVGLLVTKSESCKSSKRPRDIFDIYLAISQPQNREKFFSRLTLLKKHHAAAFELLKKIRETAGIKGGASASVRNYFEKANVRFETAADEIRGFLDRWLI